MYICIMYAYVFVFYHLSSCVSTVVVCMCSYRVGDKGELLVKSEEMCTQGYHNNVSQSAKSFADGW